MGDVGVATEADVNSQYWNPAKYPFNISRAGVSLNYTPWLRQLVNDMDLAYLSGYYRIGNYSAVSGSLRYFSMGEVFLDQKANSLSITPYEMSLDVAYSLMLSEKFSLAAAVRWIYSDLKYSLSDDTALQQILRPIIRTISIWVAVNASWAWVLTSPIWVVRSLSEEIIIVTSYPPICGWEPH